MAIQLVPKEGKIAETALSRIDDFKQEAERSGCIGVALIGIRADHTAFVLQYSETERLVLLGAVMDLAGSLMRTD